jgi:hypothetical protein
VAERLPELLDTKALMAELGVTRGVAESMMRKLPKYREGRRVFVKRSDVHRHIESNMTDADGFALRRTA